jgi:hypothetical protein
MIWELLLTDLVSAAAAAYIPFRFYKKLRAEVNALQPRLSEAETLIQDLKPLAARADALEMQLKEVQGQNKKQTDWLSEAESLNLNHRGQVIRLHRRGDSIADIASALHMGQGEVLLITKIYEISQETGKRGGAARESSPREY